jgi:CubicO group peptidase (beta-lactamase class C family)
LNEPVIQQCYEYTKDFLSEPDSFDTPPGIFEYSNVAYMIAGAVTEKVTGESEDDLMTNMLFKPLGGVTTAGFGPMVTGYKVNQPWQHDSYNNASICWFEPW